MSKIRIAALTASLVMAIPVFAQTDQTQTTTKTTTTVTTTPSTMTQDTAKAYQQAADMLNDPNVHWTIKEQTALLVEAPYVRPSDIWELNHMFRNMSANDERVIFDAITNTIRDNAGDYYTRRAAEEAYWQNLYSNPSSFTTVTTTPSGATAVTTTTTASTPPPTITTPSTTYTPSVAAPTTTREQSMVGVGSAIYAGMSDYAAWELMQKDLNAQDRTTFRMLWDGMTSAQQLALIDIARQSNYYFTARSHGVYFNPY